MDSGGLFTVLLIIIVFFLTLYAVVRAAVISGMKEYESEKAYLQRHNTKEKSSDID